MLRRHLQSAPATSRPLCRRHLQKYSSAFSRGAGSGGSRLISKERCSPICPSAPLSSSRLKGGRARALLLLGSSGACVRTAAVAGTGAPERNRARSYATAQEMYSKDLYSILGISSSATPDEIKSAFYKKAKEYHPDVNKENPGAQKKFVEATSAYEILRDTRKRQEYDGIRRSRSSSSSTYTSYSHTQTGYGPSYGSTSYGSTAYGGGRTRSRTDDFAGMGMGHEDFMRWYQQRSDIFDEFERMFKEISDNLSKKMRQRWHRMYESGELNFDDIYDMYGHVRKTQYKAKKREMRRRMKMEKRRAKRANSQAWDGTVEEDDGGTPRKKKQRNGEGETIAAEEGGDRKRTKRKYRSRAKKDYAWGRRRYTTSKKDNSKKTERSEGRDASGGQNEKKKRENKEQDSAKRKERQWQRKKEQIRKRWQNFDANVIFF